MKLCSLAYLVIEVDEHGCGYEADGKKPRPVGVVDDVGWIVSQSRDG